MRKLALLGLVLGLLVGCGAPQDETAATISPTATPADAGASNTPFATASVTPTMVPTQAGQTVVPEPAQPGLTASAMPATDPTTVPATTAVPATSSPVPTAEQTATLPGNLNQITWHSLRFRYDPQQYVFAQDRLHELPPGEFQPHEAARLMQIPNRCLHDFPGSDCFPSEVRLKCAPVSGQ